MPFTEYGSYIPPEVPKNKFLVFVCTSGLKSMQVARYFTSRGF